MSEPAGGGAAGDSASLTRADVEGMIRAALEGVSRGPSGGQPAGGAPRTRAQAEGDVSQQVAAEVARIKAEEQRKATDDAIAKRLAELEEAIKPKGKVEPKEPLHVDPKRLRWWGDR